MSSGHWTDEPGGFQTHLEGFAALRDSGIKHSLGCVLEGKMQIRPFARFAQNNAVPVSDFVRKTIGRFYGFCFGEPSPRVRHRQNRF